MRQGERVDGEDGEWEIVEGFVLPTNRCIKMGYLCWDGWPRLCDEP